MASMLQSLELLLQLCPPICDLWTLLRKFLTNSEPISSVDSKVCVQQFQNIPLGTTYNFIIDREGYCIRETFVGN